MDDLRKLMLLPFSLCIQSDAHTSHSDVDVQGIKTLLAWLEASRDFSDDEPLKNISWFCPLLVVRMHDYATFHLASTYPLLHLPVTHANLPGNAGAVLITHEAIRPQHAMLHWSRAAVCKNVRYCRDSINLSCHEDVKWQIYVNIHRRLHGCSEDYIYIVMLYVMVNMLKYPLKFGFLLRRSH